MWSDNIAQKDYLGFEVHANLIKGLVDEPGMLPITIGVFGDWGSGKSSIMETLKVRYDEEHRTDKSIVCLQFNGWIFEGYDDAKAALISSILECFQDRKSFGQKTVNKARKLAKSVNWMRVLGFGVKNIATPLISASLTGGASLAPQIFTWLQNLISDPKQIAEKIKDVDIEEIRKKYFKENPSISIEEQYQMVRQFRKDFKELLDEAKIRKLIILIDDLDRCLPDRIIDNLEAIKLFLNVENTAFVIGADPRIVRDAIRQRYKELINRDENSENGRVVIDYLEKLIQIPYTLPKLSESEVETYITLLFCEDLLDDTDLNAVHNAFKEFRVKDRYSIFGIEQVTASITDSKTIKKLKEQISLISKLSPLIAGNLDGNPRQIKRFLNTFMLRKKLAEVAQIADFRDDILAKLMILEYAEPNLFTELYSWQAQNRGYAPLLKEFEKKCDGKEIAKDDKPAKWKTPKVRTWLDSEPYLASVDLRDYFWISRDRLNSISSVMTPPIVKTILNSLMVKSQAENLIIKKIEDDVLTLEDVLQHELFKQLAKRAEMNKEERTHILNLFESMLTKSCNCTDEFKSLCLSIRSSLKPAQMEILNRIVEKYPELQDIIKE
ncbi:MAG: KAP family NTPase [Paramuribaculum sp.]|nr:KAP family NTPase [Paramuribaculum sp.]